MVSEADKDSGSESLAFKLYADGIRELSLHQELTEDDLAYFLDSLWAAPTPHWMMTTS